MKRKMNTDELPSLESLLKRIEVLREGTVSIELFLPRHLTFLGRLACGAFPEALVLDHLLHKGLVPIRGEPRDA